MKTSFGKEKKLIIVSLSQRPRRLVGDSDFSSSDESVQETPKKQKRKKRKNVSTPKDSQNNSIVDDENDNSANLDVTEVNLFFIVYK